MKWLPNVLSLGNLFLGFLSIIFSAFASYTGNFTLYIYTTFFIIFAGILDMLDGRVARRFNFSSSIGKELDSFADLITFTIAPGCLFFFLLFGEKPFYPSPISDYFLLGVIIAFLFPLFGAIRLAKYDLNQQSSNFFVGIPTTMAGGSCTVLLTFSILPDLILPDLLPNLVLYDVLFGTTLNTPTHWWVILVVFVFYAVLMNLRFAFPKVLPNFFNFSRQNSFKKNLLNALSLLFLFMFLKFFTLFYILHYTMKPLLTYKRIPRSLA